MTVTATEETLVWVSTPDLQQLRMFEIPNKLDVEGNYMPREKDIFPQGGRMDIVETVKGATLQAIDEDLLWWASVSESTCHWQTVTDSVFAQQEVLGHPVLF